MMTETQVPASKYKFVREVQNEFGVLVEIFLSFVASNALDDKDGVAVVGPLDHDTYGRVRNVLKIQPNLAAKYGVDYFRFDDADKTIRALVRERYRLSRQNAIVEQTPIAFNAMCDAVESAKKLNLKSGILYELNDQTRMQIEEFVKNEKDIDIIFGVATFEIQESLRCLSNTVIEDGYLLQAAAQAHDSADGWGAVKVADKQLLDRLAEHVEVVNVVQFDVSGFAVDRDSGEIRAVVLRPEAE